MALIGKKKNGYYYPKQQKKPLTGINVSSDGLAEEMWDTGGISKLSAHGHMLKYGHYPLMVHYEDGVRCKRCMKPVRRN